MDIRDSIVFSSETYHINYSIKIYIYTKVNMNNKKKRRVQCVFVVSVYEMSRAIHI